MAVLEALEAWHWLVLGLILLGLEALGAGGFLLGAAAAGILLSLLMWIWPEMAWSLQLMVFALSAVLFTVIYWRGFRRFNQATEQPQLNDRAAQLVGRVLVLEHDLLPGEGKIQVGDTLWRARTEQPLAAGSRVRIVASEGMVLQVEAAQ
ncbi:NfeD family protein [Ferrimonas balearica]|uniref:NfeD family protein n=1 Tax=Ferrimonas balearica TaxID=44012 RepID=UPI001C5B4974|nr:NfeD family protein [Ferrimonas balearica]MBW3166043.1 NfeD family protein [Ferrimonas balearica]MBY6108220.1 NfeD family protein [Ferrimonas balearica]MBY6225647.1 NfeD family protein [Ferrimonas balearica]